MNDSLVQAHVWVSGHVQGVFFRDSARQEAARLGLSGWVRNLPDGRVEAVFEGTREAVAQAVEWCHTGPPRARVESVEAQEGPAQGLKGFGSGPPGA